MIPLIICAAVTGGSPARANTPHHPATPDSVAQSAIASWRAGAAIVHIHARLEDETTITTVAAYQDTIRRIRAGGCDAILSLSAGDDGGKAEHAQRLSVADVGEELVSLDLGPVNIGMRLYDNRPSYLREMGKRIIDRKIKPEIDIFDSGHLNGMQVMIKDGLLKPPYHVQFVFGLPGGIPLDLRMLPILIARLPAESHWSISCQGVDSETFVKFQMAAFVEGGHIRTGMEDHVYVRPGELAKSNEQMVEQWVQTARIWGRPVATPADARRMLGLAPR